VGVVSDVHKVKFPVFDNPAVVTPSFAVTAPVNVDVPT
jgi:hypothetical protein